MAIAKRIGAWCCVVIVYGCAIGSVSAAHPHPTSRFVADHVELPTRELHRGQAVDAAIHGPDVHRYVVSLRRGQFAAVQLDQVGGNLVAVLFDPRGNLLDIVDQSGAGQSEVITVHAEHAGRYAIQVAVFEWNTPQADYRIELTRRERAGRTPVARARQLFDSWYPHDGAGAAVLVLRDGKVLLKRARGRVDVGGRRGVRTNTAFDLASVSKQFTAYAVALLIERGVLRVQDSIRHYLPELPTYADAITVQQLLEHTGGLRDWDGLFALTGRTIEDGIDMDEVLAMLARQRAPLFAPGTRQEYSNTGYVLLAHVIERATGERFDSWLRAHVLQPLGMRGCALARSRVAQDRDVMPSYASRWPRARAASTQRMITLGSSALSCSIEDLRRWLANCENGTLGGASVLRLVNVPRAADGDPANDYVFGNWHATRAGHPYIGHQGLAAGFRTSMRRYPEAGLAFVFLSNDGSDAAYPRIELLEDLFLGVPAPKIEAPDVNFDPPAADDTSRVLLVADYRGTYDCADLGTRYVANVEQGALVLRHERAGSIRLAETKTDEFAGDRWFLPRVRFVRDAQARVTGLTMMSEDVGELTCARRVADF
jgi:CubicO group peptidase (beta-lactamase class C family)